MRGKFVNGIVTNVQSSDETSSGESVEMEMGQRVVGKVNSAPFFKGQSSRFYKTQFVVGQKEIEFSLLFAGGHKSVAFDCCDQIVAQIHIV